MQVPIKKQGLYDPRYEHDACGIGVIANLNGIKNHEVVDDALTVLENLSHRGASGADPITGDGAGITVQIPHAYFNKVVGFNLPNEEDYGVAQVYFHSDEKYKQIQFDTFVEVFQSTHLSILGTRDVPTNTHVIGDVAKASMPSFVQVFIQKPTNIKSTKEFEYRLYVARKKLENIINSLEDVASRAFYIASCSSQTIVYKGMLTSHQLRQFYPDLSDLDFMSAMALVHARFSTNTFPSWERAHPYRYTIHNGEINTIQGNVNWMKARHASLSTASHSELKSIFPIIDETGSDSSMFDNAFEFLVMTGRSLPHAMMMMIPEPWENDSTLVPEKKAFYMFHNFLMEPWEGPAAMAFTDGTLIGATLDRNGLRPSRYYVTKDHRFILASEVGVLPHELPSNIVKKGRLMPGKMLVIDLNQKRIIPDEEIKMELAQRHPYADYIKNHLVTLGDFETSSGERPVPKVDLIQLQKAFGYTQEDIQKIIIPMGKSGNEPIGSMGMDTPLAILSNEPQLLYSYFKHSFAQVTNPPLDGIREAVITSSKVMLGSVGNLLDPDTKSGYALYLDGPIVTNGQLKQIKEFNNEVFKTKTLSTLYLKALGTGQLEVRLNEIFKETKQAIQEGYNLFLLSDRGLDETHVAIPMLLAASGLHHFLIDEQIRTDVSIIVETADAREVHHFATLFGYGVTAINPYLVFETLKDLTRKDVFGNERYTKVKTQYIQASVKGMMKILSKMGISTLRSYHGSQLFEAIGIHQSVIDKYFTGTPSRIGGITLNEIAKEVHMRHDDTFQHLDNPLKRGSKYHYTAEGEPHLLNPKAIQLIQKSARENSYQTYKEFAKYLQSLGPINLRDLLEFVPSTPIPLDEVESVESILKRFKSGAMSYGSISKEAHETIAIAMNRMGGKSNSGEGGEDPTRYQPLPSGDSTISAIKQIASARFGVTSEYLINAEELQIKIAQGAKPGEGGHLPGSKVYPSIAEVRHSTPGVGLISPPPHHDIYSIEDLAELIYDLKMVNDTARINVKLVSEAGVGTVAVGVAKGKADGILISGYDGGTGASPLTSIQHAGLPWELGLSETHQTLLLNNLRNRVKLETDGKLLTGRDVAIAAILGAQEFGFATLPLVTLGCVMLRACHNNTCPMGIATQNEELRKRFKGKPENIVNFFTFIAMELREIMANLGIRRVADLIGRVDLVKMKKDIPHWKAHLVDLSKVLFKPVHHVSVLAQKVDEHDHDVNQSMDVQVLKNILVSHLKNKEKATYRFTIHNTDRVVGTLIGSLITKQYGDSLEEGLITLTFIGSAGQSFGAFIPKGLKLRLEGDANDYIGKGLSGGTLVVTPESSSLLIPSDNIIIGNVTFYGATSGYAFIQGVAGERFGVRNSGATLVVEGTGDHAAEYMTGGTILILGKTGKNIAAGMSGGIVYVYQLDPQLVNTELVSILPLNDTDKEVINALLSRHRDETQSEKAQTILSNPGGLDLFTKILPHEYQKMMTYIEQYKAQGYTDEDAQRLAFVECQK